LGDADPRGRGPRGRLGGEGGSGEDGAGARAGGSAHPAPGARPARQVQVHARARQDPAHHLHRQPLHQGNLDLPRRAYPARLAARGDPNPSSIYTISFACFLCPI
jgi:hypothetical protein